MSRLHDRGPDDLVGISEAARMLGVTEGTVRKWSNEGRIPTQRTPGRQRRFRVSDLRGVVRPEPRRSGGASAPRTRKPATAQRGAA